MENILFYAEHSVLLNARLANSIMRGLADKVLGGRQIMFKIRRGSLLVLSYHGPIPYFHPSSPIAHQHAVMKRSRTVHIGQGVEATERVNDLLSCLMPHAEVYLKHIANAGCCFTIPNIRRLAIDIDAQCSCSDSVASEAFEHGARKLSLHIRRDPEHEDTNTSCLIKYDVFRKRLRCLIVNDSSVLVRDAFERQAVASTVGLKIYKNDLGESRFHWRRYRPDAFTIAGDLVFGVESGNEGFSD